MEELTRRVFETYQQYPFPGQVEYRVDYSLPMLAFLARSAPEGKRSLLEDAAVLEAGCGTGNTLVSLAQAFPSSSFTGVDMTTRSLAIARERAAANRVRNLELIEHDILTLDLGRTFQVVLCIGVLHHLANMERGMEVLARHTAEDGILLLWLYGRHGRYRLNLNQRMLRTLFAHVDDLAEKVRLAKKVLSRSGRLMECHFNVPDSAIEDKWSESLAFVLHNDAWLVDQFLHVNERTVDITDILGLADANGLELAHWSGVSMDLREYVQDEEVVSLYDRLPARQRLEVLDDLLKPKYYYVALRKVPRQP